MKSPGERISEGLLTESDASICSMKRRIFLRSRSPFPPSSRAGASLCRPWHYGGCTRHPGYRHHAPTAVTAHGIAFAAAIAGAAVHGLPAGQPQARRKRKQKKSDTICWRRIRLLLYRSLAFPGLPGWDPATAASQGFAGYRLARGFFPCAVVCGSQYTSAQAEALVLLGIQAGRHEAGPADAAHGGPAVGHHTAAACVILHARFGNGRANCQTKCNRKQVQIHQS